MSLFVKCQSLLVATNFLKSFRGENPIYDKNLVVLEEKNSLEKRLSYYSSKNLTLQEISKLNTK